jgi:hypothetical protein
MVFLTGFGFPVVSRLKLRKLRAEENNHQGVIERKTN